MGAENGLSAPPGTQPAETNIDNKQANECGPKYEVQSMGKAKKYLFHCFHTKKLDLHITRRFNGQTISS